jgi:hypothetical protein
MKYLTRKRGCGNKFKISSDASLSSVSSEGLPEFCQKMAAAIVVGKEIAINSSEL